MIIDNNFFLNLHSYLCEISEKYILPNIGKIELSNIKTKPDNSKATIHDLEIENLLINYFKKIGFNSFIAEESFPNNFNDKKNFLTLDPIDGTRNFINGLNKVAIMISYIEDENLIFSIIHNPINNDFYHLFNNNIFKNFNLHSLKQHDQHIGFLNENGLNKFSNILGSFKVQDKSSSIGYDMIQILEGDRSFIPIHKGRIWDIFPVLGFLEQMNFKSLYNKDLKFNFDLSNDSFFYYAKI